MDEVVNNTLPFKMLLFWVYSDEQRQLVGLIQECLFITDVRLFYLFHFYYILKDFICLMCVI